MKSNNILTYVLYGLLGLFILVASYYACEKQKEKKAQAAREAAELEETIRDMYPTEDSTATNGSVYSNKDSLNKSNTASPAKPGPSTKVETGAKPNTTGTTKSGPTLAKPKPSGPTKKSITTVKGPGSGRWAVRAGTFTYKEGARRRLEEVIKAGYPNAEISKTKEGLEAVIVFRSNDKNAALRVVDRLEAKGIESAVFDRNK
ncbi:MAG: SPOR domain-containing protein [Saprospiraceae bacterium]